MADCAAFGESHTPKCRMFEDHTRCLEAHLQLCEERVLSQEARNRELSSKPAGLNAVSMGLFTLSGNVLNRANWPTWIMAACFAVVAVLALMTIIRPANWAKPRNLFTSEEDVMAGVAVYALFLMRNVLSHRWP